MMSTSESSGSPVNGRKELTKAGVSVTSCLRLVSLFGCECVASYFYTSP